MNARVHVVGRCLSLLPVLVLAACAAKRPRPPAAPLADGDPMFIHTLPVGAGNCQVLECPSENKLVVFDCGTTGAGTQGWDAQDVTDYIHGLMDNNTEVVVTVSHPDADHHSYLPTVFHNSDQVTDIAISQQLGDYPVGFRTWVGNEQGRGATLRQWNVQYTSNNYEGWMSCWAPDGGGGWDLDVPGYILVVNAGATRNDNSMVVAMDYGHFQTVFTGDMTGVTEAQINVNHPVDLQDTDVITGAHHGAESHGSNSASWTDANEASMVIFSAGTRHLHPRCNAVDPYLPWLSGGASQHTYQCGVSGGGYVARQTTDNVVVTDDQGLVVVSATDDGDYDYHWGAAGLGRLRTTPRATKPCD